MKKWQLSHCVGLLLSLIVKICGSGKSDKFTLSYLISSLVCYLTTAKYCSYVQRPSPSVDRWYMVWMIYDSYMISGDECGVYFPTFVLRLRENPGKTSTRKLTWPGIEPGPAAWEVTMLLLGLDHSGGLFYPGRPILLFYFKHRLLYSSLV